MPNHVMSRYRRISLCLVVASFAVSSIWLVASMLPAKTNGVAVWTQTSTIRSQTEAKQKVILTFWNTTGFVRRIHVYPREACSDGDQPDLTLSAFGFGRISRLIVLSGKNGGKRSDRLLINVLGKSTVASKSLQVR